MIRQRYDTDLTDVQWLNREIKDLTARSRAAVDFEVNSLSLSMIKDTFFGFDGNLFLIFSCFMIPSSFYACENEREQ